MNKLNLSTKRLKLHLNSKKYDKIFKIKKKTIHIILISS